MCFCDIRDELHLQQNAMTVLGIFVYVAANTNTNIGNVKLLMCNNKKFSFLFQTLVVAFLVFLVLYYMLTVEYL